MMNERIDFVTLVLYIFKVIVIVLYLVVVWL